MKGLEDVVAVETNIAYIDGITGILAYRGININDLMDNSFEEVCYLLVKGQIPSGDELEEYKRSLREARPLYDEVLEVIRACNKEADAMDVLRTAVSYMAQVDEDYTDNSMEASNRKAIKLIAKFPTIVAAYFRIVNGEEPVQPDLNLSHGANFLYMLTGKKPNSIESEVMEKDLILSAEHGLNASTFASRIAASTHSDIYSAIISGICTLKGPLHGGARLGAMEMLDSIGSLDRVEKYVNDCISNKKRVAGFGHRVYKTYDPRAKIYRNLAEKLDEDKPDITWYEVAKELETVVEREYVNKHDKPIYPNIDFYAAVTYKYLDIPPKMSTSIFALGRVSGWTAHCIEQYSDNRLIRPRAKFIWKIFDK
ncbi:citrate/2-methylcitrate synthase [Methanosalsum natronophilum]|nr:citrate/2-methylcitrate synthase [Methanosalsum natronophilum]MCS3924608.1 citrate synthase [Methanosalsum natronophilum]